jgi:hypothetical protein
MASPLARSPTPSSPRPLPSDCEPSLSESLVIFITSWPSLQESVREPGLSQELAGDHFLIFGLIPDQQSIRTCSTRPRGIWQARRPSCGLVPLAWSGFPATSTFLSAKIARSESSTSCSIVRSRQDSLRLRSSTTKTKLDRHFECRVTASKRTD